MHGIYNILTHDHISTIHSSYIPKGWVVLRCVDSADAGEVKQSIGN